MSALQDTVVTTKLGAYSSASHTQTKHLIFSPEQLQHHHISTPATKTNIATAFLNQIEWVPFDLKQLADGFSNLSEVRSKLPVGGK